MYNVAHAPSAVCSITIGCSGSVYQLRQVVLCGWGRSIFFAFSDVEHVAWCAFVECSPELVCICNEHGRGSPVGLSALNCLC